ncbi:GIY-YIG nuclease family protein [Paenibacillus allorhizosphaerae]|uniref:UvrABC system protein C n=1 Tax=Paenibacillus allorhizosphaerae TaxID=2849866 RepID=A0ABM8VMK4_9BACL|nr:GIY-YIG nuclease family protein [Paenibacillus allorhizosphaerae]CAG7650133.1 UvrABC system protein C [Paenibacillus allorhizosphaerae]
MSFVFQAADYPASPGCYIMKDAAGRILYVGKSKNLRSRLRSYFTKNHSRRRIRQLVGEIAAIEAVLVNNEAESLLLENNLIKIHKPPYNRALKRDNSGYAYLQLTNERLPRLSVYYRDRRRTAERKTAPEVGPERRFGPYQNTRFRDVLLEFVTEHYGLRTCEPMPKRACLLLHIGKCSGICEGNISEADYRERAEQAAELLANRGQELIGAMYAKMEAYAERLEFEKAQRMLRYIRLLERKQDKQIVDRESAADQDVLYFGEDRVLVAKVQEGMLRDFQMHELVSAYAELACDSFLIAHYGEQRPDELIVNKIADPRKVRAALRVGGSKPVKITLPKRGLKRDLLELCKNNYDYRMSRDRDGRNEG